MTDEPGHLALSPSIAAEMLAHARAAAPQEACGLLAGRRAGPDAVAAAFHPARNEHASERRFSVHPQDLVRIVMGIEDAGQELVGIFHSHPRGPAVPSPTDVREARYPGAVHVLATLSGDDSAMPRLRAWRIAAGAMNEVPIRMG